MPVRVRRAVRRAVSEKPVIRRRVVRRSRRWPSSMSEDVELRMEEEDVFDRVGDGGCWSRMERCWRGENDDDDDDDDDEDNDDDEDDECLAAIFAGVNAVTLFRDTTAKMHSMVMECRVVDFIFLLISLFLLDRSPRRSCGSSRLLSLRCVIAREMATLCILAFSRC
mmetsp:Transcript_34082/g.62692  ORF Transcript_34082/g.62692 Transcript_34082/m.62692 type:complete len:167 (-) Transcript_34082:1-501(-)